MTHKSLPAEKEIFILRLWQPTSSGQSWYGQVQNVRTGRIQYVKNLRELLDYLDRQLNQHSTQTHHGLK
jgi:hypothetical protein